MDFQGSMADWASQAPAITGNDPTFSETFSNTFDQNQRVTGYFADQSNQAEFAQKSLDAYQQKFGEQLPNPYHTLDFDARQKALAYVRGKFSAKAQAENDPSLMFPSDDDVAAGGLAIARAQSAKTAALSQGAVGPGATLGGLAGGIASSISDPINALAIAAIPEGGPILRAALMAGASFGASEAVHQAATYGYQQAVNPDYGLGDALQSVISSAIGGAAFEGGGRVAWKQLQRIPQVAALGAAWRQLRGRAPEVPLQAPPEVRDAGNVAEKAATWAGDSPFDGPVGEAAHNDAIAKVESDIMAGQEPELPPSTVAENTARTGDVIGPKHPSIAELLDQHAWSNNPELYSRAYDLENQIAQARGSLDELRGSAGGADTAGQLLGRIDELQDQLSQITGKRRSSPRAKALAQQIADLKAQSDALEAGQASKDTAQAQVLRERLNELQLRRAALGPEIRAARQVAARELDVPGDMLPAISSDEARTDANPSHSGRLFTAPPKEVVPEQPPAPQPKVKGRPRKNAKAPEPAPTIEMPPPAPAAVKRAKAAASAARTSGDQVYSGKRAVRVKYELSEAGDLVTSHDTDFNVNPDYPAELQPRDRSGAPQKAQVFDIAQNLIPEKLGPQVDANSGAPIVGPDNVVESGNGRTLALRLAYGLNNFGASAYRAMLERMGYDTSGMKAPILIGRRISDMTPEERANFAHATNGSQSARLSAVEQALSDARLLSSDIIALDKGPDLTSAANRDFARAFVAKLPAGEQTGLLTKSGALSQTGVRRLQAARVARAFGDPEVVARVFDHADENIRGIGRALTDSAGAWAKMRDAVTRGDIPRGLDTTDDLMATVRAVVKARTEGRSLWDVLMQGDMFHSDLSMKWARVLFKDEAFKRARSIPDMTEALTGIADDLSRHGQGMGDLLGEAPSAAKTLDARVVRLTKDALSDVGNVVEDPKVAEAREADLARRIEQGQNRVPTDEVGADGKVTSRLGVADSELFEANAQLDLAKEIRACSLPAAETAE
jgi:ddrB-like ParB superfamily domain